MSPPPGRPKEGSFPLGGTKGAPATSQRLRIGILGGSFDPVHNGHVALANSALDHLKLDELRWVPAGQPWQKADRVLASAEHRAAMVRLSILNEPRFRLDETELLRAGPSYTIDTIDALHVQRRQAEFVLILGQDQYAQLHTWHEWPALLSRVTLAVASRDGVLGRAAPALRAVWHRVELLPMPEVAVSSTQLREKVARGDDIRAWVPAPVARYIELHGLYRAGSQ